MEKVMKLATKIAGNGFQAAPVAKKVIRDGIGMDFAKASELEAGEFGKQFSNETTKEGMKAFLEKRKPEWG